MDHWVESEKHYTLHLARKLGELYNVAYGISQDINTKNGKYELILEFPTTGHAWDFAKTIKQLLERDYERIRS